MHHNVYKRERELDQFYTNPLVSDYIVNILFEVLPSLKEFNFIEPSAGTGNFITSLVNVGILHSKIKGYDIDPKINSILKQNYLTLKLNHSKKRVILGNPPFGHRGKLALIFLNKALTESDIVAMILPNIFNRFTIQSKVISNAKLIHSEALIENAFILNDKQYGVKCVFQIWITNYKTMTVDLRIKSKPAIKHPDVTTWIHNNTKETLKYFNKKKYGWDIAVHRQGFYDYNKIITNSKELINNRQYFFIKFNVKQSKNIIKQINFKLLASKNTQTPGFSTADFINEYKKIKERENVKSK